MHERGFTTAEALKASEAFFTSATSLATPVLSIDGIKIGNGKVGPITKKIQAMYINLLVGNPLQSMSDTTYLTPNLVSIATKLQIGLVHISI